MPDGVARQHVVDRRDRFAGHDSCAREALHESDSEKADVGADVEHYRVIAKLDAVGHVAIHVTVQNQRLPGEQAVDDRAVMEGSGGQRDSGWVARAYRKPT